MPFPVLLPKLTPMLVKQSKVQCLSYIAERSALISQLHFQQSRFHGILQKRPKSTFPNFTGEQNENKNAQCKKKLSHKSEF